MKQHILSSIFFCLLVVGGLSAQTPVTFSGNANGMLGSAEVSATLAGKNLTKDSLIKPVLDENILVIKDTAFKDTKGYRSIIISKNVVKMGKAVFAECHDLKVIYFKEPDTTPICEPSFEHLYIDTCSQITYKGFVYKHDTLLRDTLINVGGCDSVVWLTLTINPDYSDVDTVWLYNSDFPHDYGDSTFLGGGDYDMYFRSVYGCDSVIHLHIGVLPDPPPVCEPSFEQVHLDSCKQVTYKGFVYNTNTVLQDTLVNVGGCDSIVLVTMTITPGYSDTDTVWLYNSDFSYAYGDSTFFSGGNYDVSFTSVYGCDSLIHLHIGVLSDPIPVDSIRAEIVVLLDQILALSNVDNQECLKTATYEWYRDDIQLSGSKSYINVGKPVPAGDYKVIAIWGDEAEESLERTRTFDEVSQTKASPNPVNLGEAVNIVVSQRVLTHYEVYGMSGQKESLKLIGNNGNYSLQGFKKRGTYIVKLFFDINEVEILKIIVQ